MRLIGNRAISIFALSLFGICILVVFQNCTDFKTTNSQLSASADNQDTLPDNQLPERDPFFGVHIDLIWELDNENRDEDLALIIDSLVDLGVGSLRIPIRWRVIDPQGSNCSSDDPYAELTPNEANIKKVLKHIDAVPANIDILVYLTAPPDSCIELIKTNPVRFSRHYSDYVEKVVKTVGYRVKNYEVWNEQNNNHFALEVPNKSNWTAWNFAQYILVPGYAAVKNASAGEARAIMGGLVYNGIVGHYDPSEPPENSSRNRDIFYVAPDFLQTTITALQEENIHQNLCGESDCFDAIGIHPYWYGGVDLFGEDMYYNPIEQTYGEAGTASVLASNGHNKGIWWTEFGEHAAYDVESEEEQAASLLNVMQAAQMMRTAPEAQAQPLERVFWFILRDNSKGTSQSSPGLLDSENRKRPAYEAYKEFIKNNQIL